MAVVLSGYGVTINTGNLVVVSVIVFVQSLNDYRQEEQRVVDRREFDLNDPDAKKKDLPARVCVCVWV